MYSVTITSRAERDMKRLERSVKNRIVTAILAPGNDPRPPGCVKVKSEHRLWRIRIADWRVGYEIDDAANEVAVIRIAHRREFYD
ncbi:MAG TPA: type II toxin-antitoxin system RelE/ParE family toxin [Blastocatellia bacterium]|nr:type II toxin-antitoxin system RelE/ParE family toxin [Blastocatellia bacterium]